MISNKLASAGPTIYLRLFVLASLVAIKTVYALEFVVTNPSADLPDTMPGDGVAMAADGTTTLRAAVEEANVLPGPDVVLMDSFDSFCTAARIRSGLTVLDDVELRYTGHCSEGVIRRAVPNSGPDRSFHVEPGASLKLVNLTTFGDQVDFGGGAYVKSGASITLVDSSFEAYANIDGGVIYNDRGHVRIEGSSYLTGSAGERGGGIYNSGGTVSIIGPVTSFTRASVASFIYNDMGTVLIDGPNDPLVQLRSRDSQLTDISGIYNAGGTVSIRNHTFLERRGAAFALYNESGTAYLENVRVGKRTTTLDGAALVVAGGDVTVYNSIFYSNVSERGGAIAVTGGALTLLNVNIMRNTASSGAGLYVAPDSGAAVRIGNSVIAGNHGPEVEVGEDVHGPVTSLGHNLIGNGDASTGFGAAGDLVGTTASPVDHELLPLNANTTTYNMDSFVPEGESIVIDGGDSALLIDGGYLDGPLAYDHRGAPYIRFSGASVDIGAHEYQVGSVAPMIHSADLDADEAIALSEVLRVIQFFNSDGLHCDVLGEDGYRPGPGDTGCTPHTSDYTPMDWRISLGELLRIIQIYNADGYAACPEADPPAEDGYCLKSFAR